MNFQYCSSCGHKIEYMLHVPNFCPSCGIALKEGVTNVAKGKVISKAITEERGNAGPLSADETDSCEVPNIQKLEYEVDSNYSSIGTTKFSFAELMGNPELSQQPKREQLESNKPTKKKKKLTLEDKFEAVKETVAECKSSADNVVDVEE